jgi:hypothetical protein
MMNVAAFSGVALGESNLMGGRWGLNIVILDIKKIDILRSTASMYKILKE